MLSDFFVSFKYRTPTETDAPLGGKILTWADGNTFSAGIFLNNSQEMQIAYQSGMKKQYTIVCPDGVTLTKDMRIKRVSDGAIFRITADSADTHTPVVAELQYSYVTAEVFVE
jgi:head-tail adaptor